MNVLGKIRRLRLRDGLSISEISRRTGLARNTVKHWLKSAEGTQPKYRRAKQPTVLSPYEDRLRQWLEADARRAKRDRRSALALFKELQSLGFTGSYTRVTEYVRRWREVGGKSANAAFVPLHFAFGEAFQFDWGEEALVIGGFHRKVLAAHTKLCASRAFHLSAYPTQSHEMLFDAHTRAFRAFGGIPRRGIYDNMRTAVDKVGVGKRRIVNTRFAAMAAHYLFDTEFCNVAAGWEKGVVEKNVQDSRRRIWLDARDKRFSTLDELNAWLLDRCIAWARAHPHPEMRDRTIWEMFEAERPSIEQRFRDTLLPHEAEVLGNYHRAMAERLPRLMDERRSALGRTDSTLLRLRDLRHDLRNGLLSKNGRRNALAMEQRWNNALRDELDLVTDHTKALIRERTTYRAAIDSLLRQ